MKTAQIVLVEDNPADVRLVQLALKEKGIPHFLTTFDSGEEAVRALCGPAGEHYQPPDAILLDLNTPKTDGFEALRRLKQDPRLLHVPIAILTSSHAPGDKVRAALQHTRYIEKPSQLDAFLDAVGDAVKEMLAAA